MIFLKNMIYTIKILSIIQFYDPPINNYLIYCLKYNQIKIAQIIKISPDIFGQIMY